MQPTEINALKALVKEFVDRINNIDNEIELLISHAHGVNDFLKARLLLSSTNRVWDSWKYSDKQINFHYFKTL